MSLITKQNRVRAEYKIYKDVSDTIKLHDDSMIHINDLGKLGLEKGMVEVIQKLYERKNILKEISEAELYHLTKEKSDEMEEKLRVSDQFFANINETVRKTIDGFFVNQGENLARTKEWQSYHMIFSGTEQLSLMTKAEAYVDTLNELVKKKEKFLKVKKETLDKIKYVEKKNLKRSYKELDRTIQEEQAIYDREHSKLKKLYSLEQKGVQKWQTFYTQQKKAFEMMDIEQKRYGSAWKGKYGLQAEKLQIDMDQLQVKLDKVKSASRITFSKVESMRKRLDKLKEERMNDELNNALHEYENTYHETFDGENKKIPEDVSMEDWIKSCQQSAKKLWEKQNLHKGNHNDSLEFTEMMQAMKDIVSYPDDRTNFNFVSRMTALKDKAKAYSTAKEKQFRPFPSTMRITRMKMANLFESWVESVQFGVNIGWQNKYKENGLNTFYENKGKSEKTTVDLGPNKLDRNVIPEVHKMLDKINENFKDSLRMEDTIGEVSKDFEFVFNEAQIAYSLGYKSTDDVKNMKLSDVVNTLTQVYGYQPKENVNAKDINTKTIEQEIQEMDVDMEIG
ncbi:MAG: hypothetical protein IKW30_06720 [Lachnospiraceae bacterium]|nr:hypothetical protein [Lachnospiraceae bacterium]